MHGSAAKPPSPAAHPHPQLKLACFNVNGLSPFKFFNLIELLNLQGVDVCVLTETHWTPASPLWFLPQSGWTCLHTDYAPPDADIDDLALVQRGGVCVLTRTSTGIQPTLAATSRTGHLTMATWILSHPSWGKTITLTGLYRSPGHSPPPLVIQQDLIHCSAHMLPPSLSTVHILTGDFNAHTAAELEGPHVHALPS